MMPPPFQVAGRARSCIIEVMSLRDADRADGSQLAVQWQVEHARQVPPYVRAEPMPPCAARARPRSSHAATAAATRCCREACAPPASDPAAASLSSNVPRPSLSQVCALAPVAGLADGAVGAPSGAGSMTPATSAVMRRRPRVVVCERLLRPQGGASRLPARHARRAIRWQAHGRRAQRCCRRRRCRARHLCVRVSAYEWGSVCLARGNIFSRHDHARDKCTFDVHTRAAHLTAHGHVRHIT